MNTSYQQLLELPIISAGVVSIDRLPVICIPEQKLILGGPVGIVSNPYSYNPSPYLHYDLPILYSGSSTISISGIYVTSGIYPETNGATSSTTYTISAPVFVGEMPTRQDIEISGVWFSGNSNYDASNRVYFT